MGLSFFLIPLVVGTLDRELYGVWSFLNGLAAYSNLIYLGLGAAFMKYFSEAKGREDEQTLTRLLGVACTLYAFLGLVCLAVSVGLSPFVPRMFATPLPPETAWAAQLTTVFLGLRLMFFFVASAFSALLAAHGRMDLLASVSTVGACLRTGAAALAMGLPNPLVALATVVALEAVYQVLALWALSRVIAPSVRVQPAWPTGLELRGLYGFGFQAFFVQLAVVLIGYTDTALIGVFIGAGAVTVYSLPLQLVEYSRVLVNGVTMALLPELSASRARGDTVRLKDVYLRAARICASLAVFINVHIVLLGPAFLGIWVGPGFEQDSKLILVFLSVSAVAGALSTQVLAPFYQAFDLLKVLVKIILAEALVNVVLSVWLSQRLGLWGVALATAIPATLITLIWAPRYILGSVGVRPREFVRNIVFPAVALGVATIAVQLFSAQWIGAGSYVVLAVRVGLSCIVALPIVVAVFPRAEWEPLVVRFIR